MLYIPSYQRSVNTHYRMKRSFTYNTHGTQLDLSSLYGVFQTMAIFFSLSAAVYFVTKNRKSKCTQRIIKK